MQRNSILMVAAVFCVVAAVAGYLVAGMSSQGSAVSSAPGGVPTPTAAAAESPDEVPTGAATSEPVPTTNSAAIVPEATAGPEATAAPETTAAPEATAAPEPTVAGTFIEYTVQRGDELLAIAKKFNVSAKDILNNNDIPNVDSLRVGQVLRIPQ